MERGCTGVGFLHFAGWHASSRTLAHRKGNYEARGESSLDSGAGISEHHLYLASPIPESS